VFLDLAAASRRLPMRQMLTSWTSLYGAMSRHFPAEYYHQGAELTDFGQSAERVEARFADAARRQAVCWLPLMAVGPSSGAT
jgi:hypothetical protein